MADIDDIGWMILTELQADARLSFRELGRRVGLTAPAVAERVRRLEREGVIRGYRVDLDLAAIGLPITAMVRATPGNVGHDDLEAVALELPEVLEAHRVTGPEHMWVKIAARSLAHLDEVLKAFWSGSTTTNLVLNTLVDHRPIDQKTISHTPDAPHAAEAG